jgi:hypothetical protein
MIAIIPFRYLFSSRRIMTVFLVFTFKLRTLVFCKVSRKSSKMYSMYSYNVQCRKFFSIPWFPIVFLVVHIVFTVGLNFEIFRVPGCKCMTTTTYLLETSLIEY